MLTHCLISVWEGDTHRRLGSYNNLCQSWPVLQPHPKLHKSKKIISSLYSQSIMVYELVLICSLVLWGRTEPQNMRVSFHRASNSNCQEFKGVCWITGMSPGVVGHCAPVIPEQGRKSALRRWQSKRTCLVGESRECERQRAHFLSAT